MAELSRTEELTESDLAEIRALMDAVFGADFDEHDWEHALGGVHALVRVDGELIGHGSVVSRQLMLGKRSLRAGYVEALGVHPGHRRQGHGGALMKALEGVIAAEYEIGALATTDAAVDFYTQRGWIRWKGRTSVLTPVGAVRTREDDGGVFVFPLSYTLDPKRPLMCAFRNGDPW